MISATKEEKHELIRKKFLEHLGDVISKKRKRVNYSQQELGELIGVSDSTITRYEKGQIEIPSSFLPLISMYCRFPMREYLTDKEISVEQVLKDALDYEQPIQENYISSYQQSNKRTDKDGACGIVAKQMSELCTEEEAEIIIEIGQYAASLGNNDTEVFYKRSVSRCILYSYLINKQDEEQKKKLINLYENYTRKKFPKGLE